MDNKPGLEQFILDKLEKLDDKLDQVKEESVKLSTALQAHERRDEDIHRDVKEMADKFTSQLDEQCKQLKEYNHQLEIHIKGVNLLEQNQKKMWERVQPVVQAHEESTLVKKYFSKSFKKKAALIAIVGSVAGAVTTIAKLLELF